MCVLAEILAYPKYQFQTSRPLDMTQTIAGDANGTTRYYSRNFSTFSSLFIRERENGLPRIDQDRFVSGVDINHFNRAIVRAARTSK